MPCCGKSDSTTTSNNSSPVAVPVIHHDTMRKPMPSWTRTQASAIGGATHIDLTIPPTPLGPLEEAEKRMKLSPKYRRGETVNMRYTLTKILGAGGFAVVKLAVDKSTGKQYACKIITLPKNDNVKRDEVTRTEVFQEIEIASCANHRNIVSVREFFISDRKVSLIMDFMEGGMVLDSLLGKRNGRYTEDDARGVMKQVLEGLEYLHARNVAHRDLKLENILLVNKDDLSHVKIVDFGLSKHTTGMMTSVLGTPQFVSPEMLRRDIKAYGVYVDMWSAGVLLYIFLSGFPPFYDSNEHQLFKKIMAGNYSLSDPVWNNVSDAGKDLIGKLLVKEPDRRLTATQALHHEWFSSMQGLDLPLQETRKNLMKLRRAKILQKAGKVVVALDKVHMDRTDTNIQEMAMKIELEDMKVPAFILDESE